MKRARWLLLVLLFLLVGLPRWLESDGSTTVDARESFSTICRDHGGRPAVTGTASTVRRVCLVRYGRRVYRMDAVTPDGFDADAAHSSAWAASRRDGWRGRRAREDGGRRSCTTRRRASASARDKKRSRAGPQAPLRHRASTNLRETEQPGANIS